MNQSHRPDPANIAHPMARPYKSIPSPRSSQCRAPPWRIPTNHFHRPIQSRAPMASPHQSIPSPRSSQSWNSLCTVLLVTGLHISALSQPPTGFLPKPVTILLPQALPPSPPPFCHHSHTTLLNYVKIPLPEPPSRGIYSQFKHWHE